MGANCFVLLNYTLLLLCDLCNKLYVPIAFKRLNETNLFSNALLTGICLQKDVESGMDSWCIAVFYFPDE